MSGTPPSPLMLFPLELVLLPGELLPLHIFEERYRHMVRHCRETGDPFGIVLRHEDGVAAVGCTARLWQVIEEYPDGRFNIVARGQSPFRLTELVFPEDPEAEPLAGFVEYLQDDDMQASPGSVMKAERLRERIRTLSEEDEADAVASEAATEDDVRPEDSGVEPAATPSYRLAAGLDMDATFRQRLLQLRDEEERLELLTGYMETLLARLEVLSARQDAIRGNGKGY